MIITESCQNHVNVMLNRLQYRTMLTPSAVVDIRKPGMPGDTKQRQYLLTADLSGAARGNASNLKTFQKVLCDGTVAVHNMQNEA